MASARKGCRRAKPAVEMVPARRPMQSATLSMQAKTSVDSFGGIAGTVRTHPGWIIMLQVEPTATPPAKVAFCTSTMEKCPRRRLEKRKVATQLPERVHVYICTEIGMSKEVCEAGLSFHSPARLRTCQRKHRVDKRALLLVGRCVEEAAVCV